MSAASPAISRSSSFSSRDFGSGGRTAGSRIADYDALGGVAGAIATRADAELHRMDAAQQMAARRFLVRLVAPGEGREDTRAVAELPGDDPVLESVVRQLANARLVVTDRGQGDVRQLVEVSHEALIRSWPQLRQWVDEDREFLRTLRRANDAKAIWLAEGRATDRLLQPGRQLGEAEELLARRVEFADLELRNYIAASQRRARRATHVRRAVALGALALAAVASLAAWGAITSRGEAERNRQIAEENRQLAEHRAERLSAALAEARASLIWSNLALKGDRLERQEVDALWQVATADPEARHAFLRQMGQSRSAVLKFARQPEPMLRALGLTLSLEDKRALLEPVLALMAQTRDAKTLRLLARAAHAIPINLTTTQAKAAQNRVVEVFATTQDPYALQSLAEAMQALGVELIGATMREATVGRIMRGLTEHRDPYALQALARALRALPVQLSAAEGEAALQPILAGTRSHQGCLCAGGACGRRRRAAGGNDRRAGAVGSREDPGRHCGDRGPLCAAGLGFGNAVAPCPAKRGAEGHSIAAHPSGVCPKA